MLKNYFKTAWRNLLRSKVYSIIAILGLAVGLAISILIFWGANDELTYDKDWPDAKNIYKLNATIKIDDSHFDTWIRTPAPVSALALKSFPGVEKAVRYNTAYRLVITKDETHIYEKSAAYTEPSFFDLFHIHFINGNTATALKEINSLVLSRDAAVKYFGNTNNAAGKTLLLGEKQEPYVVSAIMENMPEKSSVRFDVLLSMDVLRKKFRGNGNWKTIDEDWGNFNYFTFLKLKKDENINLLAKKLSEEHVKNNGYVKPGDIQYILQPLNMLRLYSPSMSPDGIKVVNLFLLIGVLIILIAIINYVNLSTARATKRAKEVGLRRVVGAGRKQLLLQFITEFIIIFFAALLIALLILPAIVPVYQSISGKTYKIDYWTFSSLKIIGMVAAATILLASIYPAWILSSFNPTEVLKSNFNKSAKGGLLRKSLVVLQFSFSIILIICTLIVSRQLHFIQTKELGFDKENIFTVELSDKIGKQLPAIIQELKSNRSVTAVSFATDNILQMGSSTDNIKWPGKPEKSTVHIGPMDVNADFTGFMNMQFAEGSGFTGTPADSGYYLINEAAAKLMNLKNPTETVIELWERPGQIKGVIKDFNNKTLKAKIEPAIFRIAAPEWGGLLYVKAKAGMTKEAVEAAGKIYKSFNNILPYEYNFLDDEFDAMYRREAQTASLFKFFAAIATLLSCLGLFGLAVFTAERRTKEIGIRKVLGASVQNISLLVSKEFTWLVIIANIIAWPVAWWAMHKWMESFAYRTFISWWIFLAAGSIALLLALLTVSSQAIKAAVANPVKSLRTE
jgi:putative ABC transport system permease protein